MSAQPARLLPPAVLSGRPPGVATAQRGAGAPQQASSRLARCGAGPAVRATAALIAWLLKIVVAAPAPALAQVQVAALQCRLAAGPWQPCRMEVQDIGLHWVLRIGEQRIEFRHSGDGSVRMQQGAGPWQPVTATWQPDTSLCWDGVCARGNLPLD